MSSCSTSATRSPRRRRIEQRPDADDAAADDEQVPRLVREAPDVGRRRSSGGTTRRTDGRVEVTERVGQAAGARRMRQSTNAVPPTRTTISSGVWKTTAWPSRGSTAVIPGREQDDGDGDGRDQQHVPDPGLADVRHGPPQC